MQGPGAIRLFLQNQTTANKKTRLAMIGYFFSFIADYENANKIE